MKRKLYFWQFAGFVFTGIAGTLLHFVYEWTDSMFFALFSAVNESVWEHMKLLFFPMIIFALFQSRYLRGTYHNFWFAKIIGILSGLILIPMLYYTYTGALGINADWFNILIFFIAAGVGFLLETHILYMGNNFYLPRISAFIIFGIIAVLFIFFTFVTPKIPLFIDPVTKTYGI